MATSISHTAALLAATLAVGAPVAAQAPARPPAGQAGTVTLSLADYDRLVERAERPRRPVEPPPTPATISRADGVIRVTGDRARGTFTLEGEVFAAGVTPVPLLRGAAIVDARLGDTPLALVRDADTAVALIEGPRTFSIVLEWGAAVTTSPGRAGLAFPVPAAGTATAQFELPAAAGDVQLQAGAITRIASSGASTRVETTLVPGSDARLTWSMRRAESQAVRNVRTIAAVSSLVSLREAETRVTSLVELSVLSGQPDRIDVEVPAGFTYAGATGASIESAEESGGIVAIRLSQPQERRHQALVSFERQSGVGGAFDVMLPRVTGVERETGEVAISADGTVELTLKDTDALTRMDVREAGSALSSLATHNALAALRYQRRANTPVAVEGTLTRFPDASLVTAVADRAVVTTLVTVDGRTLTEIALTLRNRAQPFLRVELPAGASMISAEVAGETAKLAQAPDGARVPLLRPGFRPDGPYAISFVYVQPGQPFLKKGRAELVLPKMDVPIGLVEWEMFVPDTYRVRRFEGDAMFEPPNATYRSGIPGGVAGSGSGSGGGIGIGSGRGIGGGSYAPAPGQIVGRVTDESGAAIPGVRVAARRGGTVVAEAITNEAGMYLLPGVGGRITISAELAGFKHLERNVTIDPSRPRQMDLKLEFGELAETVTVAAEAAERGRDTRDEVAQSPSQNVFNLQRRVEGVLPVRIDVPRSGAAYRFVRPLVVDEPTTVSFDYRRR